MRLCRFDDDRLGVVLGDEVVDVSAAVERLPMPRWPLPLGDPLFAHLDTLRPELKGYRTRARASRCPRSG